MPGWSAPAARPFSLSAASPATRIRRAPYVDHGATPTVREVRRPRQQLRRPRASTPAPALGLGVTASAATRPAGRARRRLAAGVRSRELSGPLRRQAARPRRSTASASACTSPAGAAASSARDAVSCQLLASAASSYRSPSRRRRPPCARRTRHARARRPMRDRSPSGSQRAARPPSRAGRRPERREVIDLLDSDRVDARPARPGARPSTGRSTHAERCAAHVIADPSGHPGPDVCRLAGLSRWSIARGESVPAGAKAPRRAPFAVHADWTEIGRNAARQRTR